jgi:DNA-directed RNA polymerase I subunit RPA2
LNYLGRLLRGELGIRDASTPDIDVGKIFLREHILVHLGKNEDKVEILCLMMEKLYALVCDEINPDNLDSLVT